MQNNEEMKEKEDAKNEQQEVEGLSGEEILNKIETDAIEESKQVVEEGNTSAGDLLSKFGISKKDKLKKENEELKQKVAEANDKYLRLYAEFDNFRKRTIKERLELIKTAGADVIQSQLPVLDDFSRALKQLENLKESAAVIDGVKLIQQKMISVLESKGLKAMKAIGETFNPEFHDAITEIEVADENMKGKVVDEIESGYFLNDKIIRHAKVVVGK